MERVKVSKTTFAVLDVRLDFVPALARAPDALFAFAHLGVDEFALSARDDLFFKAILELRKQLIVAVDQARIK